MKLLRVAYKNATGRSAPRYYEHSQLTFIGKHTQRLELNAELCKLRAVQV